METVAGEWILIGDEFTRNCTGYTNYIWVKALYNHQFYVMITNNSSCNPIANDGTPRGTGFGPIAV